MCHWGFFYKTNVVEGKWISLFLGNVMLPKFCGLCFTCESWDTKVVERVEALPCEASLGAIVCWFLVCGPFAARGAKGEEEYP
jgi:hypothetical protein